MRQAVECRLPNSLLCWCGLFPAASALCPLAAALQGRWPVDGSSAQECAAAATRIRGSTRCRRQQTAVVQELSSEDGAWVTVRGTAEEIAGPHVVVHGAFVRGAGDGWVGGGDGRPILASNPRIWDRAGRSARHHQHINGRNRRHPERQNVAQQKCATLCVSIRRSEAMFLGVIVSALGTHSPVVPHNTRPEASRNEQQPPRQPSGRLQQTTATTGPQDITTLIRGLGLFLCRSLGIGYHILQRYSRIDAKHQISPFHISHVPNVLRDELRLPETF